MHTTKSAELLARELHKNQVDKNGIPYVKHLKGVACGVRKYGDLAEQVAWLHDSVEDGHTTLRILVTLGFEDVVIRAIDAISKRPDETYEEYIFRVSHDTLATIVKISDLQNNMKRSRWCFGNRDSSDWMWKRYSKALNRLKNIQNNNTESEENMLYNVKCTETICYRDEQIEAKSIAEAKRKCHKMLVSKRLEIVGADSLYEIQEITETEFELTVSVTDVHEPIKIKAKDIEEAKEKCRDMLNKGSIDVVTTTIEIEDTTPKEIFQEENND